jgi:hypothetical protein
MFKSRLWVFSETSCETINLGQEEEVGGGSLANDEETRDSMSVAVAVSKSATKPPIARPARSQQRKIVEIDDSDDDSNDSDNNSDHRDSDEERRCHSNKNTHQQPQQHQSHTLNNLLNRYKIDQNRPVQHSTETQISAPHRNHQQQQPPVGTFSSSGLNNKENHQNVIVTESLYPSANSAFENFNSGRVYATNSRHSKMLDCSVESGYFMSESAGSGSGADFNINNQDQFNTSTSSTNTDTSVYSSFEYYNNSTANNPNGNSNPCYYNSYSQHHASEYGQSNYAHQNNHHHHSPQQSSKYLQAVAAASDYNNNTTLVATETPKSPYLICSLQSSSGHSSFTAPSSQHQHEQFYQQPLDGHHQAYADSLADYYGKVSGSGYSHYSNHVASPNGYMYYGNVDVVAQPPPHLNEYYHGSGAHSGMENCYSLGEHLQ